MKEEDLKIARKKYLEKQQENKKIISKNERLKYLKQTKQVIEYLKLTNEISSQLKTDEEILEESFNWIKEKKESSNIYVLIGSYFPIKNLKEKPKVLLQEGLKKYINYFNIYVDLETEEAVYIKKQYIDIFEKENTVIKFSKLNRIQDDSYNKEKFYLLQKKYLKMLTYTTPDKAVNNLKKLSPIYFPKNK